MGIFIGGTTDDNKMEDYEEGIFTPRIGPHATNSIYESGTGHYTKIGNKVTIVIHFENKNPNSFGSGNSNIIRVWNFPFAIRQTSNSATAHQPMMAQMMYNIRFAANEKHYFYTTNNGTQVLGLKSRDGTSWTNWLVSDFNINGFYLHSQLTYMVA